ncbi:MAG: AraC family transcriptional regulator [Bacteroidota bacterium]
MKFLFEGLGFNAVLLSVFFMAILAGRLNRFLVIWISLTALNIIYFLLLFNDMFDSNNWIHILAYPVSLLSGSAFYMGLRQWVSPEKIRWIHWLPYTLPYLLFVLVLIFLSQQEEGVSVVEGFINFPSSTPNYIIVYHGMVLAIGGVVFLGLSIFRINKYDQRLLKFYSNVESKELKWLRNLIIGFFLAVFTIMSAIFLSTNFAVYEIRYTFQVVSVLISILLILFWFNLAKQLIKIEQWQPEPVPLEAENTASKIGIAYEERIAALEQLMSEQQLFLNEELNLQELALPLQISRQQLSEVLNQGLSTNFYNYVNNYRVAYAANLLKDKKYAHYTAEGIGYESGFAARSTFFKLFKAKYGLSPAAYRKNSSV